MSDKEKGGALVFSSFADRQIVPTGTQLLANDYNIHDLDRPSAWTMETLEWLGDRALQAEMLEELGPEIKAKLIKVVRGQVSWDKIQAEVISAAFKGASDTEKDKINALIAESKFGTVVQQQAHRLKAAKKLHGQETVEINNHEDQLCGFILQALRDRHKQAIAQKEQQDPNYAAELAAWETDRKSLLEQARASLDYGVAARSHPKFKRQQERAIGSNYQTPFGGANYRQQRPVDSLEIKLEGNVAGTVNSVAKRVGNGVRKVLNLFS